MTRTATTLLALATLATAAPAAAEVVASTADGFELRFTQEVKAGPAGAYEGLIDMAKWWDPAHTYSGDAAALSLEATPGGCFCERLPGGGVEHARVLMAWPGRTLRLNAPLGPLQERPGSAVLTFDIKPVGQGARLVTSFRVSGPGVGALAAPVDGVMAGQTSRLAALLNR